ncbi:hypothetical protein A3F37_02530 [Candidatus Saccharibacteria bacterium RIFCSPHIGHO2_12_FULL_41_12]|nr:MAG: hypothetical protein A3F37_02530 [Candidatus Saccharibacteria bacterium RIFCSPHIGHO2_12_FULL_41_12]
MQSHKIAGYIDQEFASKGLAKQVASYLIDTKQTSQLDSLMRDVMTTRETRGVFEISVASAHELQQKQLDSIRTYFKKNFQGAKEIIIHTKVNPALLGGIRIESANYLIDRSLKSQLNYIKSSIDK